MLNAKETAHANRYCLSIGIVEVMRGSCHCGALTFELFGAAAEAIAVRACTCEFCRIRRARWTSVPTGRVVLAGRPDAAIRYRFGTRTADFVLCGRCGVHVAATCEIDGSLYAVLNVDCIAAARDAALAEQPVSFDGEAVDDRLARRKRSWTPARWG